MKKFFFIFLSFYSDLPSPSSEKRYCHIFIVLLVGSCFDQLCLVEHRKIGISLGNSTIDPIGSFVQERKTGFIGFHEKGIYGKTSLGTPGGI